MNTVGLVDKTRTSQTLARGLAVLECFQHAGTEYGIKELSGILGLPTTVISRLVLTLAGHGYLYQNPDTKKYGLGLAAYTLGLLAKPDVALQNAARPILQRLAEQTNETVSLNVVNPSTFEGVCVASVESSASVKLTTVVGSVRPLHKGATRKVLLAYLETWEQRRYFQLFDVEEAERQRVEEELRCIRAMGFAYSEGELDEGAYAIAVPLLTPTGKLLAGMAIAGPLYRLTSTLQQAYVSQVRAAATAVVQVLFPAL